MDPDQYRSNLRDFVYSLSFLGVQLGQPTRLLIAKHTRCKSEALPELQAAQDSLVSPGSYIFAGPNMDILGDEMKYDRCHYNEAGLKAATGLWFNAIEMAQRESAWLPMATVR
jgi:hypothetical protein